ncbi:MAG: aldo/keto reductase [Chloroflexi bacterium]|nr:aldo/keto reductase [Chloroflexota bacterium]
MEYRRLGRTGVKVGVLSLGAWVTYGDYVGEDVARECMTRAYEGGVNFFDNAEAYGGGNAEVVMGRVLRKTGWPRDTFLVSSKVFWGGSRPNQTGLSRKHVVEACHAALGRLQVDYLDLYFCHRPDPDTPVEETVRAMHDLICQGKVLYWGTSEWSADEIMQAWHLADKHHWHKPQMEQPQYHMLHRERVEKEYARLYKEIGLGTTIWSPLASGMLTGKYNLGIPAGSRATLKGYEWLTEGTITPERIAVVKKLQPIADDLGCTMAQMALAWCVKNPDVSTVITGASRVAQVHENLKALDAVAKLTPEVMERIESVLGNKPKSDQED